jgi:hypothetical protein
MSQLNAGLKRDRRERKSQGILLLRERKLSLFDKTREFGEIHDMRQPSNVIGVFNQAYRPEDAMSLLGVTTAVILIASSGTASLGPSSASTDAARIATNGGFLLGNAHRCGVATDRVVKAGQLIRQLIEAAAKDDKEKEDATDQFATFFLLTALPDQSDAKLTASCNTVTTEFQKFERHRVAGAMTGAPANKAVGGTVAPRYRPGDGE